eukprot:g19595.t1
MSIFHWVEHYQDLRLEHLPEMLADERQHLAQMTQTALNFEDRCEKLQKVVSDLQIYTEKLSIESANGAVAARRASDLEEKYNELSCSQFKMLLYRCVDSKLHTDWFHGMRPGNAWGSKGGYPSQSTSKGSGRGAWGGEKGKGQEKGEKGEKGKKGEKGEKGDKGKRGPVPWSFVPLCADGDPLGLWQISEQVPKEWIDVSHGGKPQRERLHVTFALRMFKLDHLDRLEQVCADAGPVELKVKEFFLSRVDRIRDADVYCIGAFLSALLPFDVFRRRLRSRL